MIAGKSILAVITARGGSKGLPRKNIRPLRGKPLIAWTIEAAQRSVHIDRLVLSSDDPEIISIAAAFGCEAPFLRDASLSSDTAASIDVVLDAVNRCPGHEWVVLLQPTSPLRNAADIDGTLRHCFEEGAPAGVTVCEAGQSPYWMYAMAPGGKMHPVVSAQAATRRQDLPKAYVLNGAVYAADCAWLAQNGTFVTSQTLGYEMPPERSADIDDLADFGVAESILEKSGT